MYIQVVNILVFVLCEFSYYSYIRVSSIAVGSYSWYVQKMAMFSSMCFAHVYMWVLICSNAGFALLDMRLFDFYECGYLVCRWCVCCGCFYVGYIFCS
jgi:hypothetical protein